MELKKIEVGSLGTNCYLTGDKDEIIIVDPGADADKIMEIIEKNEYTVKYIVLTHCHYDHTGAVRELKEKTNAVLMISEEENVNYSDSGVTLNSYFGDTTPPVKADVLLKEGDIIKSGKYEFKVIETPGHTSGGICLLCDGYLFSGDTLFYESIGRTDFPTGNMAQLLANVRAKIFTLPPETEVYPGHGIKTTVGYEMENNMFF